MKLHLIYLSSHGFNKVLHQNKRVPPKDRRLTARNQCCGSRNLIQKQLSVTCTVSSGFSLHFKERIVKQDYTQSICCPFLPSLISSNQFKAQSNLPVFSFCISICRFPELTQEWLEKQENVCSPLCPLAQPNSINWISTLSSFITEFCFTAIR